MAESETSKRILLWGATQVGKTALLAAALYGADPDLEGVSGQSHGHLFDVWRRLRRNQWVPPTTEDTTGIKLTTAAGSQVELIDIRGHLAHEINQPGVQQLLQKCDAILFLAEYNGPESGDQLVAVEGAAMSTRGKPFAMAFTKCERWIPFHDEVWERPAGWIKNVPLWATHRGTLGRFHQTAWPTSAFGYESSVGRPAIIIGEMGQALPFRIAPRNVGKPLAFLLRSLGCL